MGSYRQMSAKYNESPESYLGIAIVWDFRLAEMLRLQMKSKRKRYSIPVQSFLVITHVASETADISEWSHYVELDSPILELEELDEYAIYSEAIQQFEYMDTHYLLFAGKPVADPEDSDERYIHTKHEKRLDHIHEGTKELDFYNLYYRGKSPYDDWHSARWGLLGILSKWTNFDVSLMKELFEGSILFHPGWTAKNKDGVSTLDQAIHKILSTRRIYHKNEIEGYIRFHYRLRYNAITGRPEIRKTEKWTDLDDYEFNSLHRQIQNDGGAISAQSLKQLLTSDFVESFDAFKSYFEGLAEWKHGDPDWIGELAEKVTTTNQDYWSWTFKKWLVATVACAINPELTNQQVLVLSGGQGVGKSTYLEGLLPPHLKGYLYSGTLDPSSKDSLSHLAECMFINLDELDSLTRKKEAELKEIITKSSIKYRRPYGYFAQNYIRRASFMASVNHESILSDSSGSRRFLVHKVEHIDYQHSMDMDKVYAQAYALYKTGFKYWFDGKDINQINTQNATFELQTPEEEMLLSRYAPASTNDSLSRSLTPTEILKELYNDKLPNHTHSSVIKLGQALKKHGFEYTMYGKQKKWRITTASGLF